MVNRIERIVIVPRWSGQASDDWYPWIRAALGDDAELGLRVDVFDLPNRDAPVIDQCVAALRATFGTRVEELRDTILVGHSVGCQALLRYLAELEPAASVDDDDDDDDPGRDDPVGGPAHLVCVAGWWGVDAPWPSIRPWIDTPVALPRLRANTARGVSVLLSDNDPFTADWRANQASWEQRLDAAVHVIPDAKHFNAEQEPAVLAHLRELCS